MFLNYRRHFNLRVYHDYYSEGYTDEIQLVPTSKTLTKLQGGKMLFKKLQNGVTVLYRAGEDEKTPLVQLGELQLRFAITVRNATRFQAITQLDLSPSKKYDSSKFLLFKNNPSNHSDDPEDPEILNHTLIDSEEAAFFDEELPGKKVLGILELNCGTQEGELYDQVQEYLLQFRRKETYWKYLIVNKNKRIPDPEKLMIVDKDEEGSGPYTPITFVRQGDTTNDSVRVNGSDTIIFRSEEPIPFFEIPKSSFQLRERKGSVFIKHLPNPSPSGITKEVGNQFESEIYVYV